MPRPLPDSEVLFETDWLASRPVFFNTATGRASRNINEVIDFADLEIDHEGLAAYLDHGFAVFQRTPVKHVEFLPASSRLIREPEGRLRVERLPDDLDARLVTTTPEAVALDLLRTRVREIEESTTGDIIIPTSGGYDSRLLNLMVGDRGRIHSFSYGASYRQWESTEAIRARELARILGTRWERIPLGFFHRYLDDWDALYGPSVHAHGMYFMEFYSHIAKCVGSGSVLLSGSCGDWFRGKGDTVLPTVSGPSDVSRLVLSFGRNADSSMSYLGGPQRLYEEYFETNRELLRSAKRRLIEMVRLRMTLLSYLVSLPTHQGFRVYAPLADVDVGTALLGVPAERRVDERWLLEYFKACGVELKIRGASEYALDYLGMRRVPLSPLRESLLREVVRPEYVRWINRNVGWSGLWGEGYAWLGRRKGFRRASALLRDRGVRPRRLEAYWAYLTLRPIERLLQRRNEAQRDG
jgi:hypothetical protein